MKIILLLLTLTPLSVFAQDYKLLLGSGGFQGMAQVGISQEYENLSFDSTVGFTPGHYNDPDIYQLNLKMRNHFQLYKSVRTGPILFMLYNPGMDQWERQPNHYPKNYYPPTAFLFGAGWSFTGRFSDDIDVYLEFSTLDTYAETYIRSDNRLPIEDVFTWGVGIRKSIH